MNSLVHFGQNANIAQNVQNEHNFSCDKNLYIEITALPKIFKKVLNYLVYLSNNYRDIYPRQDTIAVRVGISRAYCSRILAFLEQKGLIATNYRHMMSCQYLVAPLFFDVSVRAKLAGSLPALKWLPLVLIALCQQNFISTGKSFKDEQFTRLEYRRFRYSYINNAPLLFVPQKRYRGTQRDFACQQILTSCHSLQNLYLDKIQSKINISAKGKVRLSAFPTEVLSYVDDKLTRSKLKRLHDPYAWVFKTCLDQCDREGLMPNWRWSKQLEKALDIPVHQPISLPIKRLYPIFEGFKRKEEDAITKKKNIDRFHQGETAPFMEALVGKETVEKLVGNILAPKIVEEPKPLEKKAPNQFWLNQFAQFIPKKDNDNG